MQRREDEEKQEGGRERGGRDIRAHTDHDIMQVFHENRQVFRKNK